jgi:RsmE family RNA methyltransferase
MIVPCSFELPIFFTFAFFLQKGTELGAGKIILFQAEFSPNSHATDKKLERWRKICLEAAKQCLSNVEDMLMEGHLSHCVVEQIKEGKPAKAVGEILKVYKLKRK